MLLIMKEIYAIQPYEVGTREHKCLAIIIPSKVKKKCNIDTSSIFNLKVVQKTNQILLYGPNNNVNIKDIIDDFRNIQNKEISDGSKKLSSHSGYPQERGQKL